MGDGIDRRTFVKRAGAAAAIAAGPGRALWNATPASATPFRAFEFVHARNVDIVLAPAKRATRYTMTVRKNGRKVAAYANVNTQAMDGWKTTWFTVRYVPVPGAA